MPLTPEHAPGIVALAWKLAELAQPVLRAVVRKLTRSERSDRDLATRWIKAQTEAEEENRRRDEQAERDRKLADALERIARLEGAAEGVLLPPRPRSPSREMERISTEEKELEQKLAELEKDKAP